MEPEEKKLSPEESLSLISSMINKTKDVVADNSFYFLFWGWLVFICCLTSFVLKIYFQYPNHYMVWFLMPVGGLLSAMYSTRQAKTKRARSFVDESLDYLWIALAIAFLLMVLINIIGKNGWETAFTYYILLYGIGTFVTGKLLKFKPLVVGSLINFALAVVSVKFDADYKLLIGSLAILTSYIIPGHLLRMRYKKQNR
jgi:hypothetical protein